MLTGIIVGAIAGLVVALISFFAHKPRHCPECGEDLPTPWLHPLKWCPHCEIPLTSFRAGQRAGRPRVAGQAVLVGAAVLGLGALALFLPGAIESHRVWRYQEDRVQEKTREIEGLVARGDPVSLARAQTLQDELRRSGWNPDTYREGFIVRVMGAGAGGLLAAGAILALTLRIVGRRAARAGYDAGND
jgi:hypothetical protein